MGTHINRRQNQYLPVYLYLYTVTSCNKTLINHQIPVFLMCEGDFYEKKACWIIASNQCCGAVFGLI
jgi:hypothetical protein